MKSAVSNLPIRCENTSTTINPNILAPTAEKELDALQSNLRARIVDRLLRLEENPRPYRVKKLQGQEAYRLRVGDYRILYTINDAEQLVIIYAIGHRREVYR